ncbi:MAG: hypothetical protein QOE14_353, partial [Humisphaera sp.]|nr:hypothetical protein [Humisphaera sp.]
GSRTAAVTWAVVFAIIAVTMTIFSIYFYADSNRSRVALETHKKSVGDIVPDADLQGEAVTRLRAIRGADNSGYTPQTSLLQVAMQDRDALARMVAGAGNEDTAKQLGAAALAEAVNAAKPAQLTLPANENIGLALKTMAQGLTAQLGQNKSLQDQLQQSLAQAKAQADQFEQQRGAMNKTVDAIRQEQAQAQAALATYQQTKDQSIAQIDTGMAAERQKAQEAQNNANVQLQELSRQLTDAKTQINTLQTKLGENRIDTQGPIVRNPDGQIIKIPARDIVYINLGQEASVTPGLTFEVYDKIDGIPPAGDPTTNDKLPQGKASIEVVRVGAGSSEARITRQTQGTQLVVGDLIANLIYDPNVKYNFVVYGDFDMDRNGQATAQEADVVRRLVTQWGGKLMDKVNVDTDFVVLGQEPVLPTFTREDLQDPFNAKRLEDARLALEAYDQVRNRARDLHIPIMNQNRFLSLIGFYNQAKR